MSSFNCEICGKAIIDTDKGYVTFCKHYPKEFRKKKKLSQKQVDKLVQLIKNS